MQAGDTGEGEEGGGPPRREPGGLTVLFFSDTYRPYVSGVVTSIDVYAAQLRRLGHRVIIVCPDYPRVPPETNVVRIPSLPLPAYPKLRMIAPLTPGLIGRLVDLKPDIVHVHHPFAVGLLGIYVAHQAGCPAVFTCHSFYEEYMRYLPPLSQPLKTVVRRYLVKFCSYCDLVLAPSQHLADFLAGIGVGRPLEILPTGVEPREGVAVQAPRASRRDGKAFVMAVVGRLGKEKNVQLALKTIVELTSDRPPGERNRWRLLIIGAGPESQHLSRLAVELGIKSLVTFLGEMPRERVFATLRVADCLLFPSTVETQGLVMLEAMSVGLPVVAAESPAATELITDGVEGFVAPPDPEGMAAAARRLAADRELVTRMSRAAEARCAAFRPAILAMKLDGMYRRLLKTPGRRTMRGEAEVPGGPGAGRRPE